MADSNARQAPPAAEQAGGWTDELRAEFQKHNQAFYDAHPEIAAGQAAAQQTFWSSDEGEKLKDQMRRAQAAGTTKKS